MDVDEEDGSTNYVPPELSSTAEDDEAAPRTNRPGQKGFAARLMSKYGWAKGQGLGAEGSGILQPIRVQVEKRKKKSDARAADGPSRAVEARSSGRRRARAPRRPHPKALASSAP